MTLKEMFSLLEESLKEAQDCGTELEAGKKIAAGRLRKQAQISKKLWQDIRVHTMQILKSMPTKARAPKPPTV